MKTFIDLLHWAVLYFLIDPFRRVQIMKSFRRYRLYVPTQAIFERRLVPPLFVGVGLLIAPLFLVALVVTWPDVFSPMLVSGTISSGIAMIGGFSILLYRRLRLDDEVMVIMGTSTVLALSLVLPAALAGAASPFLAATLVYGSCLAFFVMGGSAVYIGSVVTRQKYHEIGA